MRSAIIDIGYNAIRAVVYEQDTLGAPEIFNDKFKSDILNLLELTNLDTKHQTYLSLQYLMHIFKRLAVTNIRCVATAVLRGHPRALEFKKVIKEKFDIDIDIISGEQEAYLTAVGLISGITNASGIVADLGGGSLELAEIVGDEVGIVKSLPLGTKVMAKNKLSDLSIIKDIISKAFSDNKYQNLYLTGGALRLIGKYYMNFIHYPLKNLHNLEIANPDFRVYLEKLAGHTKVRTTYEHRKIDSSAILVAKALLDVFTTDKIIISNYALKEGVRFVSLATLEQQKNIVYERVKALVNIDLAVCKLTKYTNTIDKLLIEPDNTTLSVIHLALMLAQFNKNIDKTLRANYAVEFVLASDIPFTHRQRLMLGLTLAYAHSTKADIYISRLTKKMLTKRDACNSQIMGNFIRIARQIDGPELRAPSFTLTLNNDYIAITTNFILPHSIFEKVCDRLKDMAQARKVAKTL